MTNEPHSAAPAKAEEDRQLHLTILVDGKPKPVNERPTDTILDVIKKALGPQREGDADQYQLARQGGSALDPALTLRQAGIEDRETLSLTKKAGGGGSR